MYQSHWGLRESPFRNRPHPQFFYESPTHEEALARLHFLVEQQRRLGLLLGPAGSGKSLLLDVFGREMSRRGCPVARLNLHAVDPAEMLRLLAFGLRLNPDDSDGVGGLWRLLTDRLTEYRYQQSNTVVLLDDADWAAPEVLDHVTRLVQHDPSPDARLTLVLACCPQRVGRLGTRLLELAELRIDLEPWDQTETEQFLCTSLARAGREAPVFDGPAIERLHDLSNGIPRRVSQLADMALLAGAGAELQQIDSHVVDSVYRELSVVET